MTILIILAILILLILWGKFHPFLAFLITSIIGCVLLNVPVSSIPSILEKGIGSMMGSLAAIICLGAMFGKIVASSGAAQRIASSLMSLFGEKYIAWALTLTGFIVGIPLFYNVGFVLLVPLVFSIVFRYKLPAVYLGISLLVALSVTHGFLPPHPSPVALVPLFGASISTTLIYGLFAAIPAMALAGPIFGRTLRNMQCHPLETFRPEDMPEEKLPGVFNSFATSLLPVVLLVISSFLPKWAPDAPWTKLAGDPSIIMLVSLLAATVTLGIAQGTRISDAMNQYSDSVKDVAVILLIVAGAGTLKEVFVVSGISSELAGSLSKMDVNPLILGWLMATVIRICVGSATVAGLTTAGIIAPLVTQTGADPNLMVLAVGSGSLMCSHVNDSGFWMYKEYFNLSLKDTFKSWTVMETIVGVVGIVMVLIMDFLI